MLINFFKYQKFKNNKKIFINMGQIATIFFCLLLSKNIQFYYNALNKNIFQFLMMNLTLAFPKTNKLFLIKKNIYLPELEF